MLLDYGYVVTAEEYDIADRKIPIGPYLVLVTALCVIAAAVIGVVFGVVMRVPDKSDDSAVTEDAAEMEHFLFVSSVDNVDKNVVCHDRSIRFQAYVDVSNC